MKTLLLLTFLPSFTFGLNQKNPYIPFFKQIKTKHASFSLSQQSSVNYLKPMRQSPLKKQFLTENKTKPPVVLYEKTIPTPETQTTAPHNILNQEKIIKNEKDRPIMQPSHSKGKTNQASVKNFNTDNTVNQDKKIKSSTLILTPKTSTEKNASSVLFKLTNEVRLSQNLVSRNQNKPFADVPYTALSLNYSLLPLDFFMELELSPQSQSIISIPEINLSYTFKNFPLAFHAGWLPLPLGYRIENDNFFLKELSLYRSLEKNREDVGLILQTDLWEKYLSLQVSGFGGYVKRDEDNFHRAPEFPPLIVSLKTQHPFGEGFATWFKKDLALFNSLKAMGGGLNLKYSLKKLKLSVQGELWLMDEKNQTTLSYYVFPEIELNQWKAGVVLGDINRFFPHIEKSTARTSLYESIFQISWNIHPHITLTAEKFLTKQRKGPFLNDLWAVRLQTQFEF